VDLGANDGLWRRFRTKIRMDYGDAGCRSGSLGVPGRNSAI
jgi:hypothetical protein